MTWHGSHRDAIRPCLANGVRPLERAVSGGLQRDRVRGGDERAGRVDRPVQRLHGDFAGVETAELDMRPHLSLVALVRCCGVDVEIDHLHVGPSAEHVLLPVRQRFTPRRAVTEHRGRACCRRLVELARVVPHHARCGDEWSERAPVVLHLVDPLDRDAVGVAVVEQRNDLSLEQTEQARAFALIAATDVGVVVGGGDRPAVGPVVTLVPPAVEDAAVQHSVERSLHAARATRLERPARVVEPHVAAVQHGAGDRHVVVLQEHDTTPDFELAGEQFDLADHVLAGLICGMGLAGEHELHRSVGVEQQAAETIGLRQQQGGPLVRGESAGKPDGQCLRVEEGLTEVRTHERDEVGAPLRPRCPDLRRRQLGDAGPRRRVGAIPHRADAGCQELGDTVADPRVRVHAVGDGPDRHFLDRDVGPHAAEHLAADCAVELGDAVAASGEAQAHHGHVEAIVIRFVGPAADRHQFVELDTHRCREPGEVLLHQIAGKAVDAGRHRGVGGEHATGAHDLDRLEEREPGFDQLANAFE